MEMETYDEAWMDGMLAFQSSLYLFDDVLVWVCVFVFIYYIMLGDIRYAPSKKQKDKMQSIRNKINQIMRRNIQNNERDIIKSTLYQALSNHRDIISTHKQQKYLLSS